MFLTNLKCDFLFCLDMSVTAMLNFTLTQTQGKDSVLKWRQSYYESFYTALCSA